METNAEQVIFGGTGYDTKNRLPPEVEHSYPDYSIYPQFFGIAYGFLSRGCPRNCGFCADGMILVVSGIFLGFEKNVEVFVMGLFLAGITSLFLSVIRRKGRTYRIPFAPFLLAGYLFVMVME